MRGAPSKSVHRTSFDDLHNMAPAQRDGESYEMGDAAEMSDGSEGWAFVRVRPKHSIFLSHSGVQKDFVEQLCVDLERASHFPFFDKRSSSLPIGEEFAQRILTAAQECEVAVVVITDEYFYKTKWPMLELVAAVNAPGPRNILPLFFGLTCNKFKEHDRQERWFRKWDEWANSDSRIDVNRWKEALRKLDGVKGMEFNKTVGEVSYRKEVVDVMCRMVQLSSQDEIIDVVEESTSVQGNQNLVQQRRFQRWSPVLLKWSMIICFPLWFAALLKLVMIKVVIFIALLYIGFFTFVIPRVAPYFCWNQKLEPPDSKCWLSLE